MNFPFDNPYSHSRFTVGNIAVLIIILTVIGAIASAVNIPAVLGVSQGAAEKSAQTYIDGFQRSNLPSTSGGAYTQVTLNNCLPRDSDPVGSPGHGYNTCTFTFQAAGGQGTNVETKDLECDSSISVFFGWTSGGCKSKNPRTFQGDFNNGGGQF